MIGVLLINLGTPASPNTSDVRRFLKEFLSDPRVIDIHPALRWLLVHLIIAPFRSPKSAAAYRKVWMAEGSPLLHYTNQLGEALRTQLSEEFKVEVAMRYGTPSIESGLNRLTEQGVTEIRVLPLYPQYAASSTATAEDAVLHWNRQKKTGPEVKFLPPFFDHPGFLQGFADLGGPILEEMKPDHILFSFHGLPISHILKEDFSEKHCLQSSDCCETIIPANGMCYRAHCFQSARGIAKKLGLSEKDYTICFQSRLGKGWLEPFTDVLFKELPRRGIRKLAVFCPSFVADCLETLEEIQIRGQELFQSHGGKEFQLVPSLNQHPPWVQAVTEMIRG